MVGGAPRYESTYLTSNSAEFNPLGLSEQEVDDLVAFLETGLNDSHLMRYVPSKLPSRNCLTLNDEQAQEDLGGTVD